MRVELLWFDDCPNHDAAGAMLREVLADQGAGDGFEEIDASDPEVAERLRFPGSPTIRIDGVDVEPGFEDPGDYTPRCRLYATAEGLRGLPDRTWIAASIDAA